MLGTVLNTLLVPFYILMIILIFVLSLANRLIWIVGEAFEMVCDFLSYVVTTLVKTVGSL